MLMGKHKPIYDPSGSLITLISKPVHYSSDSFSGNIVDCGDYVIVTNSIKVKVTGQKEQQFLFRKHSMFPGGLKETPYKEMKKRHPEEVRFHIHIVF